MRKIPRNNIRFISGEVRVNGENIGQMDADHGSSEKPALGSDLMEPQKAQELSKI